MGIVSRIGRWLDTRFPEKISADAVLAQVSDLHGRIAAVEAEHSETLKILCASVGELRKQMDTQISEMNKAKFAVMSLRPQASTYPPVHR